MWKPNSQKCHGYERWAFIAWVALSAVAPGWAHALPSGGEIVSGSGVIEQTTPQDLIIQQDSQQLITNWQGFSIGSAESVTFQQPGVNAVALNRVIGADPSLILGKLSANGQVFLSNPSGVIFGNGAVVDVHGLLATTLTISNEDFLNGNYQFNQDPSRSLAAVVNNGTLNATRYVGLLAPAVENNGSIIVADLGSVVLASGTAATLDFNGDGLISFAVTGEVSGVVTDSEGNVLQDRINNSGLIRANGGQVLLTARSAGDVIGNVVNHSGIIRAQSVEKKYGRIILSGGDQGIVRVSGTLDASGNNEGETGGTVQVTGEKVGLFDSARVDVSGHSGGSTALIGGDYQGSGEVPTSQATYVGPEATIDADANVMGDGGTVIVWSNEMTRVYGAISARGGSEGGNGGLVETSGRDGLEITRNPNVSAPNGDGGTWLIDPSNIEIVAGDGAIRINDTDPFEPIGGNAQLGVDLIRNALLSGSDVLITTGNEDAKGARHSGNIDWNADLDYVGTGTSDLTLSAHNDIIFNGSIFTSEPRRGDRLNLNLTADSDRNGAGTVAVAAGEFLQTNNGDINIIAHDLELAGDLDSGTGDVLFTLSDGGNLILAEGDPNGANIGGDDLEHVTAENLVLTTDGNINVKGITEENTAGIRDSVILISGRNINFEESPSVFPALQMFAVTDINVNADITTTQGDFIAVADSDNNTIGNFNVAPGVVITSARDINVSAPNINANENAFNETRALILNGEVLGGDTGTSPPPEGTADAGSFQQGVLNGFILQFFDNALAGC